MTDQKTDQKREDRQPKRINPVTIVAGALASLSAAVIASFFGVAGTLIGAAVASVVSSLTAALYSGLLAASRSWVQRAARPRDPHEGRTRTPFELAERLRAMADRLRAVPRSRWLVVGGAAVVIFALAIGTLTAVEATIKEPIASALGVRSKGEARTSVGVAVRRASGGQGSAGREPARSTTTPPGAPTTATAPQPGQAPPSSTAPSSTAPASPTTGNQAPPSTSPPSTSAVQPQAPSTRAGAPAG